MGFNPFSWIGGTQADKALDIAEKATGGIIRGIDALVFTDEEKANLGKQIAETHIKLMEVLTGENTARAITRRILAVMAYSVFFFLILASFAVFRIDPGWSKHALSLIELMATIILTITIFYFGYYGITNGIAAYSNGKKPQ